MRTALARVRAAQAAKDGQLDLLNAAPDQPAPAVNAAPALQSIKQQIVPDLRPSAKPRPAPLEPIAQTQVISNKKKPSKSKRETLGQLPPDWRARIFAATGTIKPRPPSQVRKAVAILWLTGCRPSEIERGVEVQMEGGQLVITIRSSKVGEIDNGDVIAQRGIEVRRLRIDPTSTPAAELLAGLAAAGPIVVKHPKKSLRTRVNELGQEVLAKMRNPPSVAPYSFRHAMGCDLKSCDTLTDEERAMAMGHLSTESLTKYGRRRRGGGEKSPFEKIEASAVPHGARQPGQVQADSQADTTRPKG
jgi:integrase